MCLNGATCTNVNGNMNYSCQCATDFTGRDCDADVDNCADPLNNCNNGTCVDEIGSFSCECNVGFTGEFCDTDIDECANTDCFNGTCMNLIGRAECACFDGWTGASCETDIDSCATDDPDDCFGPCDDAGSIACTDGNSTFTCSCVHGHGGPTCEIFLFPCSLSPCANGGTCTDLPGGNFTCQCPSGFTGSECEINVDECRNTLCHNGSSCIAREQPVIVSTLPFELDVEIFEDIIVLAGTTYSYKPSTTYNRKWMSKMSC